MTLAESYSDFEPTVWLRDKKRFWSTLEGEGGNYIVINRTSSLVEPVTGFYLNIMGKFITHIYHKETPWTFFRKFR